MVHEIEVKILDVDVDKLVEQLTSMGAKRLGDWDQHCEYFDFPDCRLKNNRQSLRIRSEGDVVKLCHKSMIDQSAAKVMDETEVEVESFDSARKLFDAMGLDKIKEFDKHRLSFRLGNIQFDIDTRDPIPTYLEIEGPTEEEVLGMVETLGFKREDAKSWTGSQVMEHYGIKK